MELKNIKSDITGEEIYEGVHSSGLRVYIMPRKNFNQSYAIFATKYGSINSEFVVPGEDTPTKVPDGIAHYLEHKMFDMPDGTNIFAEFNKYGANANAFTSFDMTAYLFSATSNFEENLKTLLKYVQTPYFTEESVEKERGIIGQEIGMYRDNPGWRVFFNFLGCLYENHPVKIDIAGTVESISEITAEHLYKCYNTFYDPSNMVLFATGDFNAEDIADIIDKNVKKSIPPREEIKNIFPEEKDGVHEAYHEQKLSVAKPLFACGFKDGDNGKSGAELLKKYMELSILLKMLCGKSSALYKRLYEDGLINSKFNFDVTVHKDYAYTMMEGESQSPQTVFEEICAEIEKMRNGALREADFERAKRVLWGEYIRSFNSVEGFAHSFIHMRMMDIDYFDYYNVYKTVTFEDVKKRFKKHFRKECGALSVIMPVAQ